MTKHLRRFNVYYGIYNLQKLINLRKSLKNKRKSKFSEDFDRYSRPQRLNSYRRIEYSIKRFKIPYSNPLYRNWFEIVLTEYATIVVDYILLKYKKSSSSSVSVELPKFVVLSSIPSRGYPRIVLIYSLR